MKTQRSADLTIGAVFTLIGAIVIYGAMQIQSAGDEGLSSHVFPLLIGLIILATGIPLFVSALRNGTNDVLAWPERTGFTRMLVTMGSLIAYVAVIDAIGFPIASTLFVGFQVWYLGRDRWYVPVISGVVSALILYYVFIKFLGLPLPLGPLS